MKRSNSAAQRICSLTIIAAAAFFSPREFGGGRTALASQKDHSAAPITVLDQHGRIVPNNSPSATGQIFDVAVGPNGTFQFSPSTVNISAGDTVRWTWITGFHSVTSGHPCIADSQFCSPNDMNCTAGNLSGPDTVYQHTFAQAGSYSYFCAAHCEYGMTGVVNVCSPPPANMVSWWGAEGNARDATGNNDGTLQGGATFAPGMVGQAFNLDGIDDYVDVGDLAQLDNATELTIIAWIKRENTGSSVGGIVGKWDGFPGSIDNSFLLYLGEPPSENIGIFALQFDDHSLAGVGGSTVIPLDQWTFIAATWRSSDGGMKIYKNGVEDGSATGGTGRTMNTHRAYTAKIGEWGVVRDSLYKFPGQIDEAAIFNRALTASEIQAIYDAGSAGMCKPLLLTAAASRKTHGGAGTFDINMPITGQSGVECRSGGASNDYTLVFTFSNGLLSGNAAVTGGTGTVSGNPTFSGRNMIVNVTGVTNVQILTVTLSNVTDVFNQVAANSTANIGFLIGDTNANRAVNAADVAQTKARVGQAVDATNFRSDLNANGSINAADVAIVKASVGTALPP